MLQRIRDFLQWRRYRKAESFTLGFPKRRKTHDPEMMANGIVDFLFSNHGPANASAGTKGTMYIWGSKQWNGLCDFNIEDYMIEVLSHETLHQVLTVRINNKTSVLLDTIANRNPHGFSMEAEDHSTFGNHGLAWPALQLILEMLGRN